MLMYQKIKYNFLGSLSTQQSNFVNLIMQIRTKWLILQKNFLFLFFKNIVSSFLLVNPLTLLILLYPIYNAQWNQSKHRVL
jgi:hypothetical protein